MPAPVKHTCPDIDSIINAIRSARKIIADCQKEQISDEINKWLGYADDELYRLDDRLEDLRSDNSSLRDWGYELEAKVAELESEIEGLN